MQGTLGCALAHLSLWAHAARQRQRPSTRSAGGDEVSCGNEASSGGAEGVSTSAAADAERACSGEAYLLVLEDDLSLSPSAIAMFHAYVQVVRRTPLLSTLRDRECDAPRAS